MVTTRTYSVAEFERMIEAGILTEDERVELIEGEILQMNAVGLRHAAVVNRAARGLDRALGDRVLISVQNPIVVRDSEPEPDVAVLRPQSDDYESQRPTPADVYLLVEVADSSLAHDLRKLAMYARAGVPEVWLFILGRTAADDVVCVCTRPGAAGFRDVRELARDGVLRPTLLQPCSIPVSAILK